jgi:hypothetical protein
VSSDGRSSKETNEYDHQHLLNRQCHSDFPFFTGENLK